MPDEPASSFAERDPTVARVSETALRMMAGAVSPACVRRAQERVAQSGDSYPWEQVVELVLEEPGDPSTLVQRALGAQRDWVARGGRFDAPRQRRRISNVGKRAVAAFLVRGTFWLAILLVFTVCLVLLRARFPGFDIYEIGARLWDAVRPIFGR